MSSPLFDPALAERLTHGAERLRDFCVDRVPGPSDETAGVVLMTPPPCEGSAVAKNVSCGDPEMLNWSNHTKLAFSPIECEMMGILQEIHDLAAARAPAMNAQNMAWHLHVIRQPGPIEVTLSLGHFQQPDPAVPEDGLGSCSVRAILEQISRVTTALDGMPTGGRRFLILGRLIRAKNSIDALAIYNALAGRRKEKTPEITCID